MQQREPRFRAVRWLREPDLGQLELGSFTGPWRLDNDSDLTERIYLGKQLWWALGEHAAAFRRLTEVVTPEWVEARYLAGRHVITAPIPWPWLRRQPYRPPYLQAQRPDGPWCERRTWIYHLEDLIVRHTDYGRRCVSINVVEHITGRPVSWRCDGIPLITAPDRLASAALTAAAIADISYVQAVGTEIAAGLDADGGVDTAALFSEGSQSWLAARHLLHLGCRPWAPVSDLPGIRFNLPNAA